MSLVSHWQKKLKQKLIGAERIVILGIGNTQKGDDAVGPFCIASLACLLEKGWSKNTILINGGEVPENYTGEIRKFQPTHIIIIDACSAKKKPGTIFLVDKNKINNENVSTHRMPLSMLVKFLEETIGCKVIIIGIEPKSLSWTEPLSKPVLNAVTILTEFLLNLVS